jgi:hypothetical protein
MNASDIKLQPATRSTGSVPPSYGTTLTEGRKEGSNEKEKRKERKN